MSDDDYIKIGDEEFLKILKKKQEENDRHFFHMGYKYAFAHLRHISKKLECNSQLGDCLRDCLEQFHEAHFEDDVYRDGYVTTEEGADEYVEYYLNEEEEDDD